MPTCFICDVADAAPILDGTLSQSLTVENFCHVAADAATSPDGTLSWSPVAPEAANTLDGTPSASSNAVSFHTIGLDAVPLTYWTPFLSSATDDISQIAADSTTILDEIPPMSFNTSGSEIVYHIGNRELNNQQFHEYILTIPVGSKRVELHKLYIRGRKHFSYDIKANLDFIKKLGLYEAVNEKIGPVLEKAESNLLEWGIIEDNLNKDPRAKALAKIASIWGGYVCDHFRRSHEREHSLKAVASAARSVPDYTIARRLVNENILTRLEKVTGSHYRRKRYATVTDWYGIRGMAPILNPIDPLRLFALGLHLGEYDVLEDELV